MAQWTLQLRYGPLLRAMLISTLVGMVVMPVCFFVLAIMATGGLAAIVFAMALSGADTATVGSWVLNTFVLVAPITLILMPAMTILLQRRPRLLLFALWLGGPIAGSWAVVLVAPLRLSTTQSLEGLFAALGTMVGLGAAFVFARYVRANRIASESAA